MLMLVLLSSMAMPSYAASWRSQKSKTAKGYTLTARANLPKKANKDGGGAWKTQAQYGKKVKLTTSWDFYSVGGSVSWRGVGLSGSGNNTGDKYTPTAKTKTANANGYVYGTGLWVYVGMISTASFKSGNTFYSISCKI